MPSFVSLWRAARNLPADPKALGLSFKDKAVLVIGAHGVGLGAQAAIKYAALGANPLVLATRTVEKGEHAKSEIIRQTGCSPDVFIIETVDLASFASVKDFVERLNKRIPALHVVQLAGGVAPWTFAKSPDGYEMSVAVDILAPTLMALLLLPKLRETAAASPDGSHPHVSFLDSIAAFDVAEKDAPPTGENLIQRCNQERGWTPLKQYFPVKLATWYAAQGVAEVFSRKSPGVVVNATCPGLCKTDMSRDVPSVFKAIMVLQHHIIGRTAEAGARTLVSATALGPESHGKFWTNDAYHEGSQFTKSERSNALYKATWEEIITILRPHIPEGIL